MTRGVITRMDAVKTVANQGDWVTRSQIERRYCRREGPILIVRLWYYAFIFAIPFEELSVGLGNATPSKVIGMGLVAVSFLQPGLCFRWPPKKFWLFGMYVFAYGLWGVYILLFNSDRVWGFEHALIGRFVTLVQLMALVWISYNLFLSERVAKVTLISLASSTVVVGVLQLLGMAGQEVNEERLSAFGANSNTIAGILSLGLLALGGLSYGLGQKGSIKLRLCFWLFSGVLMFAIVRTGSRGALIALLACLPLVFFRGRSLATKIKIGMISLLATGFLVFASYHVDTVRVRWERTLVEGESAGRDVIYPAAVRTFLDRPLLGWGPVVHYIELGSRIGGGIMDPHNLYLWVLTEVGLIGALPFFAGLWLCWRTVWKARASQRGIVPMVMFLFLLIINLKGTWISHKIFWVIVAYGCASACTVRKRRGYRWIHRSEGLQPVWQSVKIFPFREARATKVAHQPVG